MKVKKWLGTAKANINILAGDSILLYGNDGKNRIEVKHVFDKPMKITEGRLFFADVEGRNGVGGVFLE